jgi:EAL domain-containing protein (putative c-di-GMP-specific phosphodiesterase class I)
MGSNSDANEKERARLEALQSYKILDTPAEEVFDELARLAALVGATPTALVSLVDGRRQWFKARVGLTAEQTPRSVAFCDHTIRGRDVFVVEDATRDSRFVDNPLVAGEPGIRFYAGAPLLTLDGHALGSICVIDYVPRRFEKQQREALQALATHVMAQLDLRRRLAQFAHRDAACLEVVGELRRALDAGEFTLHYLPIFDVRSHRIDGLEALLRWQHPERGLIGPAEFLHLLEESGLIVEVGCWVLNRAAADYRRWLADGLVAPRLSVNIASLQLRHPDFIAQLSHALDPDGFSRVPLDIEIHEDVLMHDPEDTVAKLREAARMGVQVAIDDFGTGYSSLQRLAHLPIDTLKIDRSLVAQISESSEGLGIVSSILSLAHGLSLSVIAEGVATQEQRKLLALLRCDRMQGFLFSSPSTPEQIAAVLRRDQTAALEEWQTVLEDQPSWRFSDPPPSTAPSE